MKKGYCYSCGEEAILPVGIGDFDLCYLCCEGVIRCFEEWKRKNEPDQEAA